MDLDTTAQLYRLMFTNTRDGMAIVRVERREEEAALVLVDLNAAALKIAGRSAGECKERPASEVFPELGGELVEACSRTAGSGGALDLGERRLGHGYYRLWLFGLFKSYVGLVFSDTSERKRAEHSLLALRKLSTLLQSTLEIERILDILIEETAALLGAESGLAAVCAPSDGISCYRYFVKGRLMPPDEGWAAGSHVPGRVILQCEPYLSNDALHDPLIDPASAERYGVSSAISIPILDLTGQMIGFLELHNKGERGGFSSLDLDQLASAAQLAAVAVKNAHAFRQISQMGIRLRESTERYQHLVEGLDAIVWEADARSLQFTYVSRRAESILGYPVSQWLEDANFWVEHIHPEDRERSVELCRRATAQGEDHRFVYRAIAADGHTVWLRDHARVVLNELGEISQLRGLMVDITEAKAIEESLKKSETLFRTTFEGAGIGMALVDPAGHPVQSNPALQSLLGYSDQELAALTCPALTHPEDAPADWVRFQALMMGELPRYQAEKRFLRKDGGVIWGRLTLSAVQGNGGIQFAVGMVEDISERKEAEAEIAQLLETVQRDAAELERRVAERTAQLEEINAELDSFAHSVSHDLRAPLRAMQGLVEILLEEGKALAETERVAYLNRIQSAARGMERLIQDLLAYSRLSRQDILLQPVSLEEVVREAAQQLELACGGKHYQLELSGEFPAVVGHRAVLVQVVLNLMTNGIKFVPAGVTPRLRIWAEGEEAWCRLYVADNGIGIPPEHQERIFKIFERLHGIESYPGTGVGLAIVRKAVTRLGGRIGVESREGEGSRFWIELPRGA